MKTAASTYVGSTGSASAHAPRLTRSAASLVNNRSRT